MSLLLVIMVIGVTTARTTDPVFVDDKEIHCYCNLPDCVPTGYMCKSQDMGCFSELSPTMDVDKAIHGCLDMLPKTGTLRCQNNPGGQGGGIQDSLFLCCREDMCNHVDSPETRLKINETIHNVGLVQGADSLILQSSPPRSSPSYSSQEVWFKAATIAVPICGALILLILILLAVKILKTDPQGLPPKLWGKEGTAGLLSSNGGVDTVTCVGGSKKVPLLFQQNDVAPRPSKRPTDVAKHLVNEKNEANAKLNTPTSDLIDLHKASHRAPCNLYKPLTPPPNVASPHHNNLYTVPNNNWS